MSTNSRFAVAIHTLAFLAFAEQRRAEPVSSDAIAQSVTTNPVVIRRLLGTLRDAGLVTSQPGSGGGWRLLRSAGEISLCEIYAAVKEGPLFAPPPRSPDPHCMVGRSVQHALGGFLQAAEHAMERSLAEMTVADVMREIVTTFGEGCADHHELVLSLNPEAAI
jgi:Rrf2 family protein